MLLIFRGTACTTLIALLLGCALCTYSGEVSGFVMSAFRIPHDRMTIFGTPIIEETLKLFPVILYAFFSSPEDSLLLEYAFSVGIGFGAMENLYFLCSGIFDGAPALLIVFRAVMGGVVHGGNTLMVGYGVSFIHKKRKLFFTGTFALCSFAIVLHSVLILISI